MKRFLKMLAVMSLALPAVSMAATVTDTNRTISKIGAQGNVAYIYVTPATTTTCLYGVLYIADTSTSSGKALYATLLSAQSQDKPLTRIDYAVQGDGTCNISLLEM